MAHGLRKRANRTGSEEKSKPSHAKDQLPENASAKN